MGESINGVKMAKIKLFYTGTQQPTGVYEVEEKKVEALLERGDFLLWNAPDESWTEKKIDEWLEKNYPSIKYNPTKDSKKKIMDLLKSKGII